MTSPKKKAQKGSSFTTPTKPLDGARVISQNSNNNNHSTNSVTSSLHRNALTPLFPDLLCLCFLVKSGWLFVRQFRNYCSSVPGVRFIFHWTGVRIILVTELTLRIFLKTAFLWGWLLLVVRHRMALPLHWSDLNVGLGKLLQ